MSSKKRRVVDSESESESGSSSESSTSGSSSSSSGSESDRRRPRHSSKRTKKQHRHKDRKQKKKKDPNAPKRARSGYFFFMDDRRTEMMEKLKSEMGEHFKVTEVAKRLGAAWKALSPEEKKPYEEKGKKDKERADKEMQAYRQKHPEAAAASSSESSDSDSHHKKKRAKKDPNAPKRNKSPYIFFTEAMRASITAELKAKMGEDFKVTEVLKEMGRRWKLVSAEDRKKYEALAEKDKQRYEAAAASYKGGK